MQVRVIGAGFSGLTTAFYLHKNGHAVHVLEAGDRVGGLISTERRQFGIVETAANALLNTQRLEALCQTIGVELMGALPSARARYIFRDKPRRWPLSFSESLGFLRGIFRVWKKSGVSGHFVPEPKEKLAEFGTRIFGRASVDYMLSPALQGIYGSNAENLSANLIWNSFRSAKGERGAVERKGSVAPRLGMAELLEKLGEYLLRAGIRMDFSRKVELPAHSLEEPIVIATSMRSAAELLEADFPQVAAKLRHLPAVSLFSVTVFLPKASAAFRGFGCLFPQDQGFRALGVLSNSHIFAERSSVHSETWILAYNGNPDMPAVTDTEILEWIRRDRFRLSGKNEEFLDFQISRWAHAIPLYGVELEDFLASGTVAALEKQGIFLNGNYLGRIGLAAILERAYAVAERMENLR